VGLQFCYIWCMLQSNHSKEDQMNAAPRYGSIVSRSRKRKVKPVPEDISRPLRAVVSSFAYRREVR
jgi:hypothetical protein